MINVSIGVSGVTTPMIAVMGQMKLIAVSDKDLGAELKLKGGEVASYR